MSEPPVKCDICGKEHQRSNTQDWVHYNGETFCVSHPGVMEWYNGALKIADQKLIHEGVIIIDCEDLNG